jgi:5-methylcytosine-specific restriction endonuclease McrA
VYDLLASGRVHLSTLQLLRDQLTDENHEELLTAVSGKGRREVQTLLAVWFPRPDRPSRISPRASIEPLSECRFRVELTASAELREKIERCCDLMSHANPSRDLAVVMERAIDLLLVDLEKKRLGATTGRGPKTRNSGIARRPVASGRVSTAVRREVFERDGSRCTFVSEDGRRCDASAFLELDHVHPRAVGGSNDVTNLRVRCRAHNQLWAEQTFGREKVQRLRQKKSNSNASACRHEDGRRQGEEQSLTPERRKLFEKVRLALTTMGFRGAEARRAVAEVSKMHDLGTDLDLERVFREALRWATAA